MPRYAWPSRDGEGLPACLWQTQGSVPAEHVKLGQGRGAVPGAQAGPSHRQPSRARVSVRVGESKASLEQPQRGYRL